MGDRADRLSSRRKDRASGQQTDAEEKQGQSDQPAQPDQREQQKQEQGKESIKDQYKGTYIYLPENLREEFDLVADEMDTARRRRNGKHVEKIRHFEPLVVALGLEQIENLDDDELEERLAEFDP